MAFRLTIKKRTAYLIGGMILLAFLSGLVVVWQPQWFIERQVVTVITHPHIYANGNASLKINVTGRRSGTGIPNALCEVCTTPLGPNRKDSEQSLCTDSSGCAFFNYSVPADLQYGASFKVRVTSRFGKSFLRGRWLESSHKSGLELCTSDVLIHLMSDKRWYQPGQIIYFRALCLERQQFLPQAGETVIFHLTNELGVKVFETRATSTSSGVAASQFYIPPDFLAGDYTLTAVWGDARETIPIKIKFYLARRIKITPTWAKPYLCLDSPFSGHIHTAYFFGASLVRAEVKVAITTADGRKLLRGGYTDASGLFPLTLTAEEVTSEKSADLGQFQFQVSVDKNGLSEEETFALPYYGAERFCEILPEDGTLLPNQTNRAVLAAYFPDGSPAPGTYLVSGAIHQELEVPDSGFVPFSFPVSGNECRFEIRWQAQGKRYETAMTFGDYLHNKVALAIPRKNFNLGEDIPLTLKFHEELKDHIQTLKLFVRQGKAVKSLDVSPPAKSTVLPVVLPRTILEAGNAELTADVVSDQGEHFFLRRIVAIGGRPKLELAIVPEKATYEPGETARVRFQLQNAQGMPCLGNISLAVVDEGILAKSGQQTVEKELESWQERVSGALPLPPVVANASKSPGLGFAPARYEVQEVLKLDNSLQNHRWDDALRVNYLRVILGFFIALAIGLAAAWLSHYPWGLALLVADAFIFLIGLSNQNALGIAILFVVMGWMIYPFCDKQNGVGCAILLTVFFLLALLMIPSLLRARYSLNDAGPIFPTGLSSPISVTRTMSSSLPSIPPLASQLRQNFPETLLFLPELPVNARGEAELTVALADNITSWNIAAIANGKNGGLTAARASIQAKQELFLEPDMPVALVCGDEPELAWRIYNYTGETQECQFAVEPARWFTSGQYQFKTVVPSQEWRRLPLKIKVTEAGQFTLRAHVSAGQWRDALAWSIRVTQVGRELATSQSGTVSDQESLTLAARMPEKSFGGTAYLKIYPSPLSELVDGMESMLQVPSG